ncbi:MAG: hypothetical protein MZV49_26125 [Rhodopseudomonas palustris]|nr:hypothetical protein [Rhodopseudomonas palustris]
MQLLGINSNIMSLGGIAIAIGAHGRRRDRDDRERPQAPRAAAAARRSRGASRRSIAACQEVGPALFFSPADHHRVASCRCSRWRRRKGGCSRRWPTPRPSPWPAAALLSVTLVPVLMVLFIRGRIAAGEQEPDQPLPDLGLPPDHRRRAALARWLTIAAGARWCSASRSGPRRSSAPSSCRRSTRARCFYMPTSLPGMSVTKAAELLQTQDRIIKSFPEVDSVYRQGRPRHHRHRSGADRDVRDGDQPQARERVAAGHDHRQADRRDGQGAAVPRRRQRLDDADQGAHRHAVHRHPHADRHQGVRHGPRARWSRLAQARSRPWCKTVPGTTSAYAERITGGYYLDIEPDRAQLARYGLAVGDAAGRRSRTALGGEMVTTTVEGRERFGVIVRYPRELRDDPQAIAREVLVPLPDGRRDDAARAGGQRAASPRARRRSAPRTRCCRPTSTSTSATATSAATSPRRSRRWPSSVDVPARLLRHLERPVRVHGARDRQAEDRRAADAG